ncbi:MAG: TlpA family protein disulfide reductase [Candidatus Marinimicrobia bacterium]|nr:TlpA family protein disulfide reductase [Candidatus Neomarinimicrobiota bacterium]MCF7830012.1 TlpA family protein disulfide reductase [Candidatus Neomarinimicrobiota bacterium]MCF7881946.1 TlpA family protein disulfide reductase [Candidatus Neomarinimicrobiota bacterium]
MNYKKVFLVLLAMVIAGGVAFIGTYSSAQSGVSLDSQEAISYKPNADVKPEAPNFQLQTIDGKTVQLDDYRGKVVVLNFWATWCPPCRKEIPDFVKLTETKNPEKFVILGVTLQSGTTEEIQKFAENMNMNYPVLTGDSKYLAKLTQVYGGVSAIPTTFIIGPDGKVQDRYVGIKTADQLWQEIQSVM